MSGSRSLSGPPTPDDDVEAAVAEKRDLLERLAEADLPISDRLQELLREVDQNG